MFRLPPPCLVLPPSVESVKLRWSTAPVVQHSRTTGAGAGRAPGRRSDGSVNFDVPTWLRRKLGENGVGSTARLRGVLVGASNHAALVHGPLAAPLPRGGAATPRAVRERG